MPDFSFKIHQIRFRLGLCPRLRWGSSQHSPDPLAGFGREREMGGEGRGRKRVEGWEGRKEKEEGGERGGERGGAG